jgi:glycosyltransferase involved in cell wall biosynthesis
MTLAFGDKNKLRPAPLTSMPPLGSSPVKSVAIIDYLDDFGIGGYIHELAEGLAANGVSVDIYSSGCGNMSKVSIARHYRVYPVLGGVLYKQKQLLRSAAVRPQPTRDSQSSVSVPGDPAGRPSSVRRLKGWLRTFVLPIELGYYLKRKNYDAVWTQWPHGGEYGIRFWAVCRYLGLRVVHTVHNVLPHEETQQDRAICEAVYKHSNALVVHSRYAARKLAETFPQFAKKTILARHGMYTTYPRMREARRRVRTAHNIAPDQVAFLVFGGVRPYKNTDALLQAFLRLRSSRAVLIVAGREMGYPDLAPGKPLARTERIAAELGVANKVRFIPGPLDIEPTSEVFEAADVLVLPYLESYGSGALLLGMTFGKHILATPTGGMEEYLEEYPRHTLLKGTGVDELVAGIEAVTEKFPAPNRKQDRIPSLEWKTIASQVITVLSNPEA